MQRLIGSVVELTVMLAVVSGAFWASASCVIAQNAPAGCSANAKRIIIDFNAPFLFAYSSWDKKVKTANGAALLRGEGVSGQGGAGADVNLDLSTQPENVPVLRVRVGANNKAPELRLRMIDNKDAQSVWDYVLPPPGTGWMIVMPKDGSSLGTPSTREKGTLDLKQIMQWQLQGDWNAVRWTWKSTRLRPLRPTLKRCRRARLKPTANVRSASALHANNRNNSRNSMPAHRNRRAYRTRLLWHSIS
jgi:hypothetical protein